MVLPQACESARNGEALCASDEGLQKQVYLPAESMDDMVMAEDVAADLQAAEPESEPGTPTSGATAGAPGPTAVASQLQLEREQPAQATYDEAAMLRISVCAGFRATGGVAVVRSLETFLDVLPYFGNRCQAVALATLPMPSSAAPELQV